MTNSQRIFLRILGLAHIIVAIILLPGNLFLNVFSIPIVLPAQIWLAILGIRLWRPNMKLQTALRRTHYVLAPFSILLIIFGFLAIRDANRSAETGGGLLGAFGLIPITMGFFAGTLSLVSLYLVYYVKFEKLDETH